MRSFLFPPENENRCPASAEKRTRINSRFLSDPAAISNSSAKGVRPDLRLVNVRAFFLDHGRLYDNNHGNNGAIACSGLDG